MTWMLVGLVLVVGGLIAFARMRAAQGRAGAPLPGRVSADPSVDPQASDVAAGDPNAVSGTAGFRESAGEKRPLYHRVPEGWAPLKLTSTRGLLRVDAVLTMGQYTGDGQAYEADPDRDLLLRKLGGDGVAFLVHLVLRHRETGTRHGVLFCSTPEEARYFPYCAQQLEAEPGWGETLYVGVVPPADLPSGEEPPAPDTITFADLFRLDAEPEPADTLYALWQRQTDAWTLAHGSFVGVVDELYDALHGYEPHVTSFLLADWQQREMEHFSMLPEEDVHVPLRGPDGHDVVASLGRESGLAFLTPATAPPVYRERLYRHYLDIGRAMVERLRAGDVEPVAYADGEAPRDWWRRARAAAQANPYLPYLFAWSPGEARPETVVPPLPYDPASPDAETLVPRVTYLPEGPEPDRDPRLPLRPLAGDLYVQYAFDRGDHYQYLATTHLEQLLNGETVHDEDELHALAVENLRAQLGESIGVEVAKDQSAARLRVSPDVAVACMTSPHIWEHLEGEFGGDLAVVAPNPYVLGIAKWTNPEARAYLEQLCADVRAHDPALFWSDALYHWRGAELGWVEEGG